MQENRQYILRERPAGMPDERHLVLVSGSIPKPGEGQALLRTIYLSLDPYLRTRMNAVASHAKYVELGAVMTGRTVSQVIESNGAVLRPGDFVVGETGWQEYAVAQADTLLKLDPAQSPISTAVGVLGMPGFTAYIGLTEFGRPKAGETVVVSAASDAVGQVVGQLGKLHGCRVVGVAGADDKCEHVVERYGFDACVNHRSDDFESRLAAACPRGIDVYFENVGGRVFDAVMTLVNDFARIPVCGRIAHYNQTTFPEGPDRLIPFMGQVLVKRLTLRGFIQSDHHDRLPEFRQRMASWVREGTIRLPGTHRRWLRERRSCVSWAAARREPGQDAGSGVGGSDAEMMTMALGIGLIDRAASVTRFPSLRARRTLPQPSHLKGLSAFNPYPENRRHCGQGMSARPARSRDCLTTLRSMRLRT
jgi:NADPH-dependent curcumin reductase CurA